MRTRKPTVMMNFAHFRHNNTKNRASLCWPYRPAPTKQQPPTLSVRWLLKERQQSLHAFLREGRVLLRFVRLVHGKNPELLVAGSNNFTVCAPQIKQGLYDDVMW